jgi:plasmid stability protein
MAQLTVRKVPEEIVRALRVRAARHGRSAESEHRLILAQALESEETDFWSRADAFRNRTKKQRFDSAQCSGKCETSGDLGGDCRCQRGGEVGRAGTR